MKAILRAYVVPILGLLAALAMVVLYTRWKHEVEASAVLHLQMASADSSIHALAQTVTERTARVTELEGAAPRIVERIRTLTGATVYTPSRPDTVTLTDTTAVRAALDAHRVREDSLGHALVMLAGTARAAVDSLNLAINAEHGLRVRQDSLIVHLTDRVALGDKALSAVRPRWYSHIGITVGYGAVRGPSGAIVAGWGASVGYSIRF